MISKNIYIFQIYSKMRFLCIRYFYLDNIHQNNLFRLDVNNFGFDIGETHDFRGLAFKEGGVCTFFSRTFYTQLPYSIHKEVANTYGSK